MEIDERQQANSDLKRESCVGAESIDSEEDSQLVEEDDGELSDASNDAKAEETTAIVAQQPAKGAQNDDELDYEEDVEEREEQHKSKGDKDEDEDGEVNSDDDLEEGEVKEDSDDEERDGNANSKKDSQNQQQRQNRGQSNQKNICKFFHKGQCTWGPSCRFVHQSPAGAKQRRSYPQLPPGPRPRPPDDYYYDHPPPPPPHMAMLPRMPPPHMTPIPPPVPPPLSQEESPWERGLRNAKAMIVKATRRKEEDTDFDDKRFNLGVEDDQQSHHSRESLSPTPRVRSPSPYHRERRDEYWSTDYERRRRLAYESAPWNDEPKYDRSPLPRVSAEEYHDPWRRSKSPSRRPGIPRRGGSNSGRRSHSMSSISGSDSGSDLSGSSFSGSSFSGSESPFSEGSDLEKSPLASHRKEPQPIKTTQPKASPLSAPVNQKARIPLVSQRNKGATKPTATKEKVQQPAAVAKVQPRASLDEDSGGIKKKVPPARTRRDSWSDSDSGSESQSGSSFYSASESGSEAMSESDGEQKKILKKKSPNTALSKAGANKVKETNVRDTGPPAKKAKPNPALKQLKSEKSLNIKSVRQLSSEPSPPLPASPTYSSMKSVSSPNSATETSQKKPIKMTFMKKHLNLKKDVNVTAKLNGGKGSDGEDDQNSGDNEANEITSPEMISDPLLKDDSNSASENSTKEMTPSLGDNKAKSAGSAVVSSTTGGSSTSSRREELLKQLKAVEDAIARKRAKLH